MSNRQVRIPPQPARRKHGYIGDPPLANRTGMPLQQSWAYMSQFNQRGQLFTYSGPPDGDINPDTDTTGTYYIPLRGPRKRDTTDITRNLNGVIVPWATDPNWDGGYANDVSVEWAVSGGGYSDIWKRNFRTSETAPDYNDRVEKLKGIQLPGGAYQPDFTWTPAIDGDWVTYQLKTTGIQVAALGIWDAPDQTVADDQLWLRRKDFAPGQIIRGFNADADTYRSLGHAVRAIGDDNLTDDSLANMTGRCLLNTGHPVGIWSDSGAGLNIGGTDCSYKVWPQRIEGLSSGQVKAFPCVVVTTTGATAINPATVVLKSTGAADDWTLSITSDAGAGKTFTHDAGDQAYLDIDYDYDFIEVWIRSPSAGEIVLHSFALWSDYYLV